MKLYLVRHGQTDANVRPSDFAWNNNCPLNATGKREAEDAAQFFAQLDDDVKPTLIVCSPLARAHQTAEIIGARLGLEPQVEPHLGEGRVGEWSERSDAVVYEDFMRLPVDQRYTFVPPGGESWKQAGKRLIDTLHDVALHNETILFVSHYEPILSCVGQLLHADFATWTTYDFPNASVTLLESSAPAHWQAAYIGTVFVADIPYDA